jgi:hypothetical protein
VGVDWAASVNGVALRGMVRERGDWRVRTKGRRLRRWGYMRREDAWEGGRYRLAAGEWGPEGRARCPSVRGAADKHAAQLRRTAALHAS